MSLITSLVVTIDKTVQIYSQIKHQSITTITTIITVITITVITTTSSIIQPTITTTAMSPGTSSITPPHQITPQLQEQPTYLPITTITII
jgi:hypothetical protein